MCPSELSERLSCSNLKDEPGCTTGGCCWDDRNPNTPCFRPFSVKCPTVNWELCTERSCCWDQQSTTMLDYGYTVSSVKKNSNGLLLGIARKPNQPSLFGQEVDQLGVEVTYETDTRLHVRVRVIASAYSLHTHSHTLTSLSLSFSSSCLILTLADTNFLCLSKRPTNKHRPNHPWLIPSHSQTICVLNFQCFISINVSLDFNNRMCVCLGYNYLVCTFNYF